MTRGPTCRSCRFSSPSSGQNINGVCRIAPPLAVRNDDGGVSSYFPPINLDAMRCGKHRRKPLWWKLFGRTG